MTLFQSQLIWLLAVILEWPGVQTLSQEELHHRLFLLLFIYLFIYFIVIRLQLSAFSPHRLLINQRSIALKERKESVKGEMNR